MGLQREAEQSLAPGSETPLGADFKLENSAIALAELRGYLGRCHQSLLQLGSDLQCKLPRLFLHILHSISRHEVLACLILS